MSNGCIAGKNQVQRHHNRSCVLKIIYVWIYSHYLRIDIQYVLLAMTKIFLKAKIWCAFNAENWQNVFQRN